MNASFADEMLEALLSATFEPVKESQEVTAREGSPGQGFARCGGLGRWNTEDILLGDSL